MKAHQRYLAAIAVAAGVAAAALALAAPGSAAPYVTAPTLSVSTTTPIADSSLTVTGTDFVPGSTVTLTLHSAPVVLGSVVIDPAGGFTTTVETPDETGIHTLVAAGPPAPGNSNRAEVTLDILSSAGPVPITGYSGAGLAGSASYARPAGLAALGCLLLGGGLLAWRRRRRHAT